MLVRVNSAKDFDNLTFDGLGITVFDAKKEILTAKKLKGNDFDIVVSHAESGEDYVDDNVLIPRNTPIVVKRVPTKPGKGTAHLYLEGSRPPPQRNFASNARNNNVMNGSISKTFEPLKQAESLVPLATGVQNNNGEQTEEDKIKAMFQQTTEFWEKTQEQMAAAPFRKFNQNRPPVRPNLQTLSQQSRPPPDNYVCFRCGQKGHYISFCPTNGDRSFDTMKLKRTTGIPKIFLQKVEQIPVGKGALVTHDGNLVIAQANDAEWQKFHERQKSYVTSNDAFHDTLPIPEELQCRICTGLLKEAVTTPCCQASYCDECIRHALINPEQGLQHFKCPNCGNQLVPDELMPDKRSREAVEDHLRDWARRRNQIPPTPGLKDEAERGVTVVEPVIQEEVKEENIIIKNVQEQSVEFPESATKVPSNDNSSAIELPETSEHTMQDQGSPRAMSQNVPHQPQFPKSQYQQYEEIPLHQQYHQNEGFSHNTNGKPFGPNTPAVAHQGYGQFGAEYYDSYNTFGYDQDQDQGYWYDDGYPSMDMDMMNGPSFYDQNYFDSGFYPADQFPPHLPFMPTFRPMYGEFWDTPIPQHHQNNFTPFGNLGGNMMGGRDGGMPPFRGNSVGGGNYRGNFRVRGRGRGRGSGTYHNDRPPFEFGRGGELRREDSVISSIGRRKGREGQERSDFREGEVKYEKDRLVDDFGRDIPRRISSASRLSDKEEVHNKKSPSRLSDHERREREFRGEVIDDRRPSGRSRSRSKNRYRSKSRSRSKDRSRKSPIRSHRSSRRHHESRSPNRYGQSPDERRKLPSYSRRQSYSQERDSYAKDERRYSMGHRREEKHETLYDSRSHRREFVDRRDAPHETPIVRREETRVQPIEESKDERRVFINETPQEIINISLTKEQELQKVPTRSQSASPRLERDDDDTRKSPSGQLPSPDVVLRNTVVELEYDRRSLSPQLEEVPNGERRSRSRTPRSLSSVHEDNRSAVEDAVDVVDVSINEEDESSTSEDEHESRPSPIEERPSSPFVSPEKRRHSSSKRRDSSRSHRHHRHGSPEREERPLRSRHGHSSSKDRYAKKSMRSRKRSSYHSSSSRKKSSSTRHRHDHEHHENHRHHHSRSRDRQDKKRHRDSPGTYRRRSRSRDREEYHEDRYGKRGRI
ncbi:hypothetical protein G9A89_016362 [Geosiphon pyriformis]|nr:hypothetical protein G9A89_016362 [Geosiphon pyriformis]